MSKKAENDDRTRARSWFQVLKDFVGACLGEATVTHLYLHLVHAKRDGGELITIFTSRLSTLTTMHSLMLTAQVAALFSPSRPTERARVALEEKNYSDVAFWAGLFLYLGIIAAILSLITTVTSWALISAISKKNAHILLRSSIVLRVAVLPGFMSRTSMYTFYIWMSLFIFVVAAWEIALPLTIVFTILLWFLQKLYREIAGIIMYSGAMGDEVVLDDSTDSLRNLSPLEMTNMLQKKSSIAKRANIPVTEQYRIKYQDQLKILEEDLCV